MRDMKKKRKMISLFLVLLIILNVIPAQNVDAASKKVSVYVVKKIINEKGDSSYIKEFTYTSKGLKKSMNYYYKGSTKETPTKYYYNGKKLKRVTNNFDPSFKYNKKGQLIFVKHDIKEDGWTFDDSINYDKKNRISSVKKHSQNANQNNTNTWKYKYNKKNLVTKATCKTKKIINWGAGESDQIYEYSTSKSCKYDKNGNLTKLINKQTNETIKTTYKNTYDSNGCVVKIVAKSNGDIKKQTYTITYEKIMVPKSYEKVIKEQQDYIIPSRFHFDMAQY